MYALSARISYTPIGPGVYWIMNLINGKVYVGSTGTDLNHRMSIHRMGLRGGRHANRHLQASFKVFGEKSFAWGILAKCARESTIALEKLWVDILEARNPEHGYNLNEVTDNPPSPRRAGVISSGTRAYRTSNKEYRFKSPSGEVVSVNRLNDLCDRYGLCRSSMSRVASGIRLFCKGWSLPDPRERKAAGWWAQNRNKSH